PELRPHVLTAMKFHSHLISLLRDSARAEGDASRGFEPAQRHPRFIHVDHHDGFTPPVRCGKDDAAVSGKVAVVTDGPPTPGGREGETEAVRADDGARCL